MRTFRNVRWLLYEQGVVIMTVKITGVIENEDLIKRLQTEHLYRPECEFGQELTLVYFERDGEKEITVADQTSDVEEERFNYANDAPILVESIRASFDYSADYESIRAKKADEGIDYTQERYVEEHCK